MLTIKEFDIILGIDWLTKYHTKLDCVSKSITFLRLGSVSFHFQYNPSNEAFFIIRVATIKTSSTELTIAQIPIVREFEDIFQDIFGLPPKREIEFCIELVPGTLPISKTPYRMAPTKMLELKKQVQEL